MRMFHAVIFVLASSAHLLAAPPEVPKSITVKPGQLVRVVAKGEGEIGTLRSFDDDKAFFDELIPKKGERRFIFQATEPGVYVVGFWTKGELEGVATIITVEGTPTVPPPPKPKDPPVIPTPTAYYFMVVRQDGPAQPAFTKTMGLAAWGELRGKGHKVKDFTQTQAKALGVFVPVGSLPAVVVLRENVTDGTSTMIGEVIPLPTTDDGVRKLAEGVK